MLLFCCSLAQHSSIYSTCLIAGRTRSSSTTDLSLLVDPVELAGFVGLKLLWLEPQSDLLLGRLNSVGAVANVSADIDGIVTTDGTWGGGKRVGGTEDGCKNVSPDTGWSLIVLHRPVLQASRPSQTMATIGPLNMSILYQLFATSEELLEPYK